jgi:GNAT superfamily N-acetyltransferase
VRDPVAVLEANFWSMWSLFGGARGCELHEEAGLLSFDTPIASLPYNGVLRFAADGDAADADVDERIDALFAHYRARRVSFFWVLHPSARPADLEARLRARGFEEAEVCPGMLADVDALPPPAALPDGLALREVRSDRDEALLLELVAWRWGVPADAQAHLGDFCTFAAIGAAGSPTRAWIATLNGAPVAKAVTHRAGGAVGLYGVATKPEARGLGVARALCAEALRASADGDHRTLILHSTPMACSLYRAMGFREVAPFRVYAAPGRLHL